jgi:hypothetical protein
MDQAVQAQALGVDGAGCSARRSGVQVSGLALAPSGGPVGPVDLDNDLAVGAQPGREPGAVAAVPSTPTRSTLPRVLAQASSAA